jgi:glycosyltransferase involved in cell wall biosynthesis
MNKVMNPKVSIVIPVYNGGDFLSQAIDSALAQTYRNIEILVVNDGSNDGGETERIALSYGNRIRYYKKPNGGVASALNMGVSKMSGEYFSWLSHDDLYVKEKVERQIAALSSLSPMDIGRTVLYSDYDVFTTDPEKSIPVLMRGVPPEEFRHWITVENTLHGCTLLIPKTAFVETGGFNEKLRTTQDFDLWFRMARTYRFVHLPERLVKGRSHPEQGSIKMSGLALAECNALLSGFAADLTDLELMQSSGRAPAVAYAQIASSFFYRGFLNAGWSATDLSFKSFSKSSFPSNARAIGIIAKGICMHYIIKPVRRLIPPHVRLAIRNRLVHRKVEETPCPDSLQNMGLKEKFSEIYAKNIFRGSESRSGEGSDLAQTAVIRRELPRLVQELGVKTFLDAPCGDWYWMKEVDLPVEQYIGLDIVEPLVEKNRNTFGSSKVFFRCMNLAEGDLPKADLIFSRDCLVHLSFADALKIIANFKRSGATYLLATTFTDRSRNEDLGNRFWRTLNMQLPPFNFPKPLRIINEECTEENNSFTDKCLGLWLLEDIRISEPP